MGFILYFITINTYSFFYSNSCYSIPTKFNVNVRYARLDFCNTTRLDFCNSILYNLPNNKIERLQRIQNQAARMLTRSPCRNHITPVLRELHWLRISDRIIFKILILTHQAFHGVAPVYLCELITMYEQATVRTRRAQDCFLLAIPPISKTCAASLF